ncbi:neuropeptide CCHamide-1 receptor [Trichonephila clavata]|uniref:Neuropeptide CCHamide-1 receptor n=1 Tax=Trichonephila clavata TaxID=2740835 RepID=A0A8X6KTY9_TRICU|nr:neuropeptide CCHamide-1 receptor [Trichonephila clavata]
MATAGEESTVLLASYDLGEMDSHVNVSINFTNCSFDNSSYIPYELRPETYIVPIIFVLIFLVGFIGNGTLILIVVLNKNMRSIPNIYITSLALGDFVVIVAGVPFISTIYTFESWPYGLVMCQVGEFLKDFSAGVTSLSLTSLSIDRFVAIIKPIHTYRDYCSKTRTIICVTLIWIVSALIALPGAYYSYLMELCANYRTIYVCYPFPEHMRPWYPKTLIIVKFLVLYLIPLIINTVNYYQISKHLRKVSVHKGLNDSEMKIALGRLKFAKISLILAVLFATCFFFDHVFLIWFYFYPNAEDYYNTFWNLWRIVGFVLKFSNSCLNPLVLAHISGKFRGYFKNYLWQRWWCCKENANETLNLSTLKTLPSSSNRSTIHRVATTKV